MFACRRRLGGSEWLLTDPGEPTAEQPALDWDLLLPILEQVVEPDPQHPARLALIALEGIGDLALARRYLDAAQPSSARAWLRMQLGLQAGVEAELVAGLTELSPPEEGAPRRRVLLSGAIIRHLVWGRRCDPGELAASDWLPRLLICASQDELAALPATLDGTPAKRSLRAHLLGDHLAQHEEQAAILRALAEAGSVSAAVTLFELASRELTDEPRREALARLARCLSAVAPAAASAAEAVHALWSEPGAAAPPVELAPEPAAAAWRALELLRRQIGAARAGVSSSELAEAYSAGALRSGADPLGGSFRHRAAELNLACGDPSGALQLLGPEPTGVDSPAGLLWIFAQARLKHWPELASGLLAAADSAPSAEVREQLLLLVSLASGVHLREIADRMELELAPYSPLSAVLLTVERRPGGDPGWIWSHLFDRASPGSEAGLIAFGLGLTKTAAAPGQALVAFRLDREHSGEQPASLAALALALCENQQWVPATRCLAALAARLEGATAARVLRLAAQLALIGGQDEPLASSLLEDGLQRAPDDLELHGDAAAVHLRAQRYREAVVHLDRMADLVEDPERETAILRFAVAIRQVQLDDALGAELGLRRALELRPGNRPLLQALVDLLADSDRQQELAEALAELLSVTTEETETRRLLLRLARLHATLHEESGSEESAEDCIARCQELLALEPAQGEATALLVQICGERRDPLLLSALDPATTTLEGLRGLRAASRRLERWPTLVAVSRRLAEVEPYPRDQLAAILEAGEALTERLQDLAGAEDCYRWAGEHFPSITPWQQLCNLLQAQDRREELARVLEERLLPMLDGVARLPALLQLGQLQMERQDSRRAVQWFEAAIKLNPRDLDPLLALEELYTLDQSDQDLARTLERQLSLVEGSSLELEVTLKLGEVYQRLGDARAALRMASRGLRLDPTEERVFAFAEQLFLERQRYADLCDLYGRVVEQLGDDDPERTLRLLRTKGQYELEELNRVPEAVETFTQVMELDPADRETLALLERVLAQTGDWHRLAAVYERRANRLTDPSDQIAALRRAAQISAQQLQDIAASERLYDRIHSLDPGDAEAFTSLERKLELRKDYGKLVTLLLDRAEHLRDPAQVSECLTRAGKVCEQSGEIERALELYGRVIAIAPNSREALDGLARLHEAREAWDDFLKITRYQIQLERDAQAKALLYFKYGSVLETKYQREEEAEQAYTKAVRISPRCLLAVHSLRELYARRDDWTSVISTLELEAQLWSDPKARGTMLAQIAEIYQRHLGDSAKALHYYRQAVEVSPENMAASLALFDAYAATGQVSEAARWGRVYAEEVASKGTESERATFFVKWARALRLVGSYEDAAAHLVRALQSKPSQVDAQRELVLLCREAPSSYPFADLFNKLLRETPKREKQMMAVISSGLAVLAEQRHDVSAALHYYEQALSLGDDVQIVLPYADLLALIGRDQEALQLVERCRVAAEAELRQRDWLAATLWLADHPLYWQQDLGESERRCQETLAQQPNAMEARQRLVTLALLRGDGARASEECERLVAQITALGGDNRALARQLHRLALVRQQKDGVKAARITWARSIELDPAQEDAHWARFRDTLDSSDRAMAQRWLEAAAEGLGANHPAVIRMRGELALQNGALEEAVACYRTLRASAAGSREDQIMLARLLHQAGHGSESIATLRELIHLEPDYLPAAEELERIATANGQGALGLRARQLTSLCLGEEAPPLSLIGAPVSAAAWRTLTAAVSASPLEAIWQVLRDAVPPRAVRGEPAGDLRLTDAAERTGRVFGRPSAIAFAPELIGHLWIGNQTEVLISRAALAFAPSEVAFLVAISLTLEHTGHLPLYGYEEGERLALAEGMAGLLQPSPGSSSRAEKLVAPLVARRQRPLAKLLAGRVAPTQRAEELAASWILAIDTLATKLALLVTGNLTALAKVNALQHGLPPGELQSPGLLSTLDLGPVVDYFLSDRFEQEQEEIQRTA